MPQPDSEKRARLRELIRKTVGDNIRNARIQADLSRAQLTRVIGPIDESYLRQVENGQKEISLVRVVELADALGVSASVLVEGL